MSGRRPKPLSKHVNPKIDNFSRIKKKIERRITLSPKIEILWN